MHSRNQVKNQGSQTALSEAEEYLVQLIVLGGE